MSRPDPKALRERLRSRPMPKLSAPKLPPLPPAPEVPRLDPSRRAALVASQQAASARMRAQLQGRLDGVKAGRRPETQRRRPWWLLVLLLLLLAAIVCCMGPCEPEVVPPIEEGPAMEGEGEAVTPVAEPVPLQGHVKPKPRPAFPAMQPQAVPWLASFRMQVSARSTRLSGCFVGATRPGVLRWTALVEPGTGRVSDHELEPVLQSDTLTAAQRDCVLGVLEEPVYRIDVEEGVGPSRVGMVIEF
jgi:hypothetical protein